MISFQFLLKLQLDIKKFPVPFGFVKRSYYESQSVEAIMGQYAISLCYNQLYVNQSINEG